MPHQGMRPDAFSFHVAVSGGGEGENPSAEISLRYGRVTAGRFGAFGMIFGRRGLAYPGGRYKLRGGADNRQDGGDCPASGLAALAALASLAVFGSRFTGRSRTEHAVARVSVPIKFRTGGPLGGSQWALASHACARARHLTSERKRPAPDCTGWPGSPPFPKCRVTPGGRMNATRRRSDKTVRQR